MSLLFNMLSRLVKTFLPRSNCLNFMAAVTICSDFGSPPNKVYRCFHCFPIFHEVMGPDAMILFPGGSEGKASACNAGDLGLIPGSGRFPGEGNGNPLQNPMDGEAW